MSCPTDNTLSLECLDDGPTTRALYLLLEDKGSVLLCIDDFDCSHAAADGVSEGGLCQAIQAAGTDTCPSPKGDNKCPKIQICKSGGTLEDFCKFKASACRESCVAAFANCDGCRSIKCKGKAASQSIKTTQAGSSPASP